jgi:hypothetical protein
MAENYSKLTPDQRKQLTPVLDKVDQAFDELHGTLKRMGHMHQEGMRCFRCDCEHFTHGPAAGLCATPGCGHRFTSHDVQ